MTVPFTTCLMFRRQWILVTGQKEWWCHLSYDTTRKPHAIILCHAVCCDVVWCHVVRRGVVRCDVKRRMKEKKQNRKNKKEE